MALISYGSVYTEWEMMKKQNIHIINTYFNILQILMDGGET